jgi:lipoprotein NlpI
MYNNSLKKKSKTKMWFAVVAANAILITFIFGCYSKINDGTNPNYMSRSDQRGVITEDDLNKFSASIKKIDGQAESHYKMALYFQQRKKHKLAINEFNRALQQDPLLTKAYNAMGISYDKLNRYDQAVRCYQSAIKLDPNLDYTYNNLGYSYLLNSELDMAIEAFQKAIELNSKNNRYHNNLALAYILNDQYDEAYEEFKTIGNDTKAKEKLASILYKLGKVKVQQYFAKNSNSERNSKAPKREKPKVVRKKIHYDTTETTAKADLSDQRSEDQRNRPIIVRKKIHYDTTETIVETDLSDQKLKDQRTEKIKLSTSDEKTLQSKEKGPEDRGSLDEKNPEQNHASLTESPEITGPKNIEIAKKHINQEFQIELDKSEESVSINSNEKETVENNIAPIKANQTLTAEYPKQSDLSEILPATEDNNQEKSESLASSDSAYYLASAELIPENEPGKNITRSIEQEDTYKQDKMKRSAYNYSAVSKVSTEPKIIEVQKSYYQDIRKPNNALKDSSIETNQKVSVEKPPVAVVTNAPTKVSNDKTNQKELLPKTQLQSNAGLKLAFKGEGLKESHKSENNIVEVEIEVVNGNGVNGAAMKFGSYLRSIGFKIARVGNANSFDHAKTKILYCNGNVKSVNNLLEKIPITQAQRNIIEVKNLGNRIKIIIGKDLINHDNRISKAISSKHKS